MLPLISAAAGKYNKASHKKAKSKEFKYIPRHIFYFRKIVISCLKSDLILERNRDEGIVVPHLFTASYLFLPQVDV